MVYQEALGSCQELQSIHTQFYSEILAFSVIVFLTSMSSLAMFYTCLWLARSTLVSWLIPPLMSSSLRVRLSGISWMFFALLAVAPVRVVWLLMLI